MSRLAQGTVEIQGVIYRSRHAAAMAYGINPGTVKARLDSGWAIEDAVTRPARYRGEITRECSRCHEITKMRAKHILCPACAGRDKPRRQDVRSICTLCGTEVFGAGARQYCDDCAREQKRINSLASKQRKRAAIARTERTGQTIAEVAALARRAGMTYGQYEARQYMAQIERETQEEEAQDDRQAAAQRAYQRGQELSRGVCADCGGAGSAGSGDTGDSHKAGAGV